MTTKDNGSDSDYVATEPDIDCPFEMDCPLTMDYPFTMDNDTDSSTEASEDIETKSLDPDELAELIANVHEYAQDYIDENILTMSAPNFYEQLREDVTTRIAADLDLAGYIDEVTEEIEEFIDETLMHHLEIVQLPPRQIRYSIDNQHVTSVPVDPAKIQALQALPQPKQKTPEWYEFRQNLISASNLWKVFGTEANVNALIYEKCRPLESNSSSYSGTSIESALHWGVKYEPVTVLIYQHMFHTMIGDFGCIRHPQYPWIGASPDGINIDPVNAALFGRMLEIKNIVNRDITGIPKEEYWIQTQIQMETLDLDECDFMETRFQEYKPDENRSAEEVFYEDTTRDYKGVILYFLPNQLVNHSAPHYVYMPLDIELDRESVATWILNQRQEQRQFDRVLFSTLYWYLDEFSCVLIPRNQSWFRAAAPKIEDVWNTIIKERETGYEHRAAKKRVPKTDDQIASSPTSRYISNIKPSNTICLVRLDE